MAFSWNHFISGCAWFRTADRFGTPQLPKRTSERRLVSLPTSTPQPFLETWRCQFTRFDQPDTYLRHCALAPPQVANPGLEAPPALGPVALLHLGSHMRNPGICYFHIITRTGLVFIHLLLRRFCQFASKWQRGISVFILRKIIAAQLQEVRVHWHYYLMKQPGLLGALCCRLCSFLFAVRVGRCIWNIQRRAWIWQAKKHTLTCYYPRYYYKQ